MALGGKIKKHKNKQVLCNNNNRRPQSIPDLPKHVRDGCSQKNICDGGITKSWRISSKQCMCNADGTPKLRLQVNDAKFYNTSKTHLALSFRSFWDPVKKTWFYSYLPKWDIKNPFHCAMVAPTCSAVIVLTGISHPAFVFCRIKYTEWSKQDCNMADPFCSNYFMQFTSGIYFQGKFYVLSLQGTLAVIEMIDSYPRITALGSKRVVPNCVNSRHFREYLVESDGEILLIFLVSRKSVNVVDDVQVFKIDVTNLSFVKMESIGDRTLFVGGRSCLSVSRTSATIREVGRTNYVYFTQHKEGWWAYDMLGGSISFVDVEQMANEIKRQYDQAKAKKRLELQFKDYMGNSAVFAVLR